MSREVVLVSKLKECIQEAVVFLRTLGDFKIPAVVERRRKELLEKLEGAQGDTRREKAPIKFEGSPEKEVATPPVIKKVKKDEKQKAKEPTKEKDTEGLDSGVTSPSRRDSKVVNSLVSGFEDLHASAKKEEVEQTPKKWQVELRKTKKPADFPAEEADTLEDSKTDEPLEDSATKTMEDSNELKPEAQGDHRGSTHSLDSTGSVEADATPRSKKKSRFGNLLGKKKQRGRDKSPAPMPKDIPATEEPATNDTSSVNREEVELEVPEVVVEEDGVKINGKLDYKVKTRLSSKFVSKDVKLKEATLYIGDKDTVMMLGCTVQSNDSGFEVFSHSAQKTHTFKVSEGGDEAKGNWVTAIQAAIDEVTPPKEEDPTESTSADTVPAIQVSEPPPSPEKSSGASKKSRESVSLEVKKPVKSLPTQEVIKGYVYRLKTGGIRSRWEKTYCVVTHSAIYFTETEEHSEYEHMFRVVAGEAIFTEKDKGNDKNSKSVMIKMGKKTEQISIDKKEFSNWWSVLQQAYCFGESLEFNDEDDISEEELIEEDLYEDVTSIPPVPNSPRPNRPFIPEVSPEDDIMIDEDIYEDTDDFIPQASEYQQPVVTMAPKLPGRNPAALPGLPPRNSSPAQPALPPRNPGPPLPSRGSIPSKPPPPKLPATLPPVPKPPAPIPTTNSDDEDLYDDVVVHDAADEDNYDDVVLGGDDDTYDDVVVNDEPITEDFYEDMTPGVDMPQEDYVVMEHGDGVDDDDDGELYVDVEPHNTPPRITTPTPSLPKSASPKTKPNSTFSRMFAGRKGSHVLTVHSGQVSYRAPKKTKFEEKFATVEDTNLLVYKTSSDKKHQDKIPLGDCALELGSKEAGAGDYALRVTKGGKVHHFSFKSQEDVDGWVDVLKKLVKYAPVNAGEQQVYQATQDHIAEMIDEITFKKGSYIRLISKDNEAVWFGQLGNEALVFDGKTGKFPAEKVILKEDMYI